MTNPRSSAGKHPPEYPRSLPASEWPDADRRAWEDACRSGSRLKTGGAASYLAEVSPNDYANRYGHSWASCSGADGWIAMPARPHRSRWQMLRATSQTSRPVCALAQSGTASTSCAGPASCLRRRRTSPGSPRLRRISRS
jgi:hypothetical protein